MRARRGRNISGKKARAALAQMLAAMEPERRARLTREELQRSWNVAPRALDELVARFGVGRLV